jgi:hypothetical protein
MGTLTADKLKVKNLSLKGSTYDATIHGTYTPSAPLIRNKKTPSMDFGGVNEYLSLANPISGLTDYTIICWANEDAWDGMFYSHAAAGTYFFYIDSLVGLAAGALYSRNPPHHQPISKTYMVAIVRSSITGIGCSFIDGLFYFSGGLGAIGVDANCFIGQFWNGTYRLNGRLDNMMFFNVALTPDQIQSIWRSSIPR